jgi:FkbM family methyltransferase
MSQVCVYTTLLGNYERINEQPVAAGLPIPFICLTDDPDLRSESWQMRLVQPAFRSDPVRSQRDLKIRPHIHLPEFARSLYIDNSVILEQPPDRLLEMGAAAPEGFVMPHHSFRQTVLDEFLEVAQLGLDDNNRVFEQLNHYLLNCPEVLEEQPWWTAIMVRDHTNPRLCRALELWALHVMRYSRRDQLSVNIALHLAGIQPEPLRIDNFKSQFHSWPHVQGRDPVRGKSNHATSLMPLPARLRLAEQRLAASGAETTTLRDEVARLQDEVARLKQQIEQSAAAFKELSAAYESVLHSTIWRLTGPLRRLLHRFPTLHSYLQRTPATGAPRRTSESPAQPTLSDAPHNISADTTSVPRDRVLGLAGNWIHVDPADTRGQQLIQAGGSLNPPTLVMWQMLLAEAGWTHVFDVGANYGEMLVNVKLPRGVEVAAVEPNPAIRARLERTLHDAGIAAEILDVAFSDASGMGRLRIDDTWSGTTRLARPDETGGVPVQTATLGSALQHAAVPLPAISALIKIDVEGDEANVLRGALEELAILGRFAVLVEVLHLPAEELDWIAQHFDIEMLRPDSPAKLVSVPRGQFAQMLADQAYYRQDVVLRRRAGESPR